MSISTLHNYNYEIFISCFGASSSTSKATELTFTFSGVTTDAFQAYSGESKYCSLSTSIFLNNTKSFSFLINNTKFSSFDLTALGYRRIGLNS